MLELIILVLTVHWLLSFFGQSTSFPGIPHSDGFIDMLSVVIVLLIIIRFLS